jgi:uncharacterized membrane protein
LISAANVTPPTRLLFIDRLRGWAVVVMIETHIVNALLRNDLRHETVFTILNFVNGLVAPTFLFCAGFAFAISSHRKWNDFSSFRPPARKYSLRLLFILMVGYALHLPIYSFRKILQSTDPGLWTSLFLVDILQVIAVTLLLLLLLTVLLRKEQYLFYAACLLTLSIVSFAPLVNTLNLPDFPVWLRGYISVKYQSQFTLFPWAGFLLFGYLLGYGYMRMASTDSGGIMKRSALAGILIVAGSLFINYIPINIYQGISFWNSPQFVYLRLGLIILLGTLLWYIENKSPCSPKPSRSNAVSLVLLFGKESLLVYSVHLIIVYGHNFSWSFISLFGENLNYANCAGLFVPLTAGMYILAYGWLRLKSWNMKYAKAVQYAIMTIFVLDFLISA